MGRRRPPDILRKSHAHSDGKRRARGRQELREELDESIDIAKSAKALLIDLDGVIYRGDELIAGAVEAVRWLREQQLPHLFLTNTTSRPRDALVEKLAGFGIEVAVDEILAPPDAAARFLSTLGCRRVLLAVPDATAAAFGDFDTLTLDQAADRLREEQSGADPNAVDAVVVGDIGAGWNFARLNTAFRYLMQEPTPRLIALGMTRYWNAPDGLRLDTAPFAVALSHASGAEITVVGKPAETFFEIARERLGSDAGNTWMIGDDIKTDVGGAQAAGLKGVLVKTGKYREGDLELGIWPDLVLESIADLPQAFA